MRDYLKDILDLAACVIMTVCLCAFFTLLSIALN